MTDGLHRRGASLLRQFEAWGAPLLLAAVVGLLCYHFGGYYARSWTGAALVLAAWAAVEGVRGRLPALKSPGGCLLVLGLGLTAWTGLSMTWAYFSSHLAWEEAGRTFLYVVALAVGAATCAAARVWSRSATCFGVAFAAVAASTLARMALIDDPRTLFSGYRVDAPIGYVNGLAAVCALGALLLLGQTIALTRMPDGAAPERSGQLWWQQVRPRLLLWRSLAAGACIAGATACACLLLMVQSRGSVVAGALALVVAIALVPLRLRFLLFAALVAIGAWSVHGALDQPFVALGDLIRSTWQFDGAQRGQLAVAATDAIHGAGRSGIIASLATGMVGACVSAASLLLGVRRAKWPRASATVRRLPFEMSERVGLGVALVVVVVACLVPGAGHRSVATWGVDQARGCLRAQPKVDTSAMTRSSHLADVGTNRCDFWRVALRDARAHPFKGIAAGNFQATYVRYGHSSESPMQTHSLPLQFAAELGVVGVALAGGMLAIVLWAVWLFALSGRERDPVFAVGIAGIAYWLAHSSIDWLWTLPGITLPIMVLAGGLVACLSEVQSPVPRVPATIVAAGLVLMAVATLLPLGYGDWQLKRATEPAFSHVQLAQRLENARAAAGTDPRWALPHIKQAELLLRLGRATAAREEARNALRLEPRNVVVVNRAARLGVVDTSLT